MALLIQRNDIDGLTVYGQQQVNYTANGESGLDYSSVVALAATKESYVIEAETEAYMQILETRQQKLEDLGRALSILTEAIATLPTSDQTSSDTSAADTDLQTAASLLSKYGLSLTVTSDNKVTRENALTAQSNIEYAIDTEDNDLQQDMVTVQGLVSKRDNAFSTAASLVRKTLGTSDTLISNMNS